LISCIALKNYVIEKLKGKWSPDVIAGTLKLTNTPTKTCTESIYQYIYSEEGKKLGLSKYLLTRREKRNMIFGRKSRKSIIEEKVSVHDRPESANKRLEEGHMKADLTFFKRFS
jgi:transposase, IS30 family